MADKDDSNQKKKKKSIIASLDLKNYKAKYTDSYGLGKPNEIDIDNFLIAEPDPKEDIKKESEKLVKKSIPPEEKPLLNTNATNTASETKLNSEVNESNAAKQINPVPVNPPISTNPPANPPAVDSNFEKRVNAEADNDFYDDKPVQQIGDTFRSRVVERKSTVEESQDFDSVKDTKEKKTNRKLNLREPVSMFVMKLKTGLRKLKLSFRKSSQSAELKLMA